MGSSPKTFEDRYRVAVEQYQRARKRLEQGEVEDTLFAARRSLESAVKEFCQKCGLGTSDDNRETTLLNMIDSLQEAAILTREEVGIFHRLRKLCNKGVHVGEVAPDMNDAQMAVDLLDKGLEILREKDNETVFAQTRAENNTPMSDPDYYAAGRRYRGMWSNCYTREELMAIPDYVKLKRRADQGDVAAMLDIAIGFLAKEPLWSNNQLVCMPPYRYRDEKIDSRNAYDARYYYWILKACETAVKCQKNGTDYPKKYIATALLEAIKFEVYTSDPNLFSAHYVLKYSQDRDGRDNYGYGYQFELTAKLFDDQKRIDACHDPALSVGNYTGFVHGWLDELLRLVGQSGTWDILSPLHREHSEVEVKYLLYCFCCFWTDKWSKSPEKRRSLWLTETESIRPEDCEKDITLDLLEKYRQERVCDQHWKGFVREIEKRRQEEEQRRYEITHAKEIEAAKKARAKEIEAARKREQEIQERKNAEARARLAAERAAEQAEREKKHKEKKHKFYVKCAVVIPVLAVFLKCTDKHDGALLVALFILVMDRIFLWLYPDAKKLLEDEGRVKDVFVYVLIGIGGLYGVGLGFSSLMLIPSLILEIIDNKSLGSILTFVVYVIGIIWIVKSFLRVISKDGKDA